MGNTSKPYVKVFFFSSAEVKTTKHLALATLSFCSGQYIDLDIFLMF